MKTLDGWLPHINQCHYKSVDLGHDRIMAVAKHLDILNLPCASILVAGTNGKGSTVAVLEAIYLEHGYHVFATTSPAIKQYNERLRIDGALATDELFCQAFSAIEAVRGDINLTFFEYSVLAVFWLIKHTCQDPDKTIALIEIGVGGRLDAFNIIDPDLSIITSIDLDHQAFLGDTREEIALEKAGILRENTPAICGDLNPPKTLIDYARDHRVPLVFVKDGLNFKINNKSIMWTNIACALLAAVKLADRLPVQFGRLESIVNAVQVPGRFEVTGDKPKIIYDVAHNPASVRLLKQRLLDFECKGKRVAVFSILNDKDLSSCLKEIEGVIDEWHIAEIQDARALPLGDIQTGFVEEGLLPLSHSSLADAFMAAKHNATDDDHIVVFGSFYVIGEVST